MLCGPGIRHPPPAHVEHRGKGSQAGDVVDDDAAGEVEHAPGLQEAAAPHHVHEGEVDEEQPRRQEEHVGLEADPVGEGAGDEGRGDDGEHHLVGDEDELGDRWVLRRRAGQGDPVEEGLVEVADEAAGPARKAERVADGEPDHGRPAHRHEALDHDGQHVLAADQPAIEEGQARRHEHHQAGADEHEAGVAGVEPRHGLPRGGGVRPTCTPPAQGAGPGTPSGHRSPGPSRSGRLCRCGDRVALATRRLHEAVGRPDGVRARVRRDPHGRAARRAARPGCRARWRWRCSSSRPASRYSSWVCSPAHGWTACGDGPCSSRLTPIRAVLLFSIPAAYLAGVLRMEQLYVVVFLEGCFGALFDAAYPAYVPSLIGVDRVVEGNSKLATSSSLAEIGGPGLGGGLVQLIGAPFAMLVDAVSFVFSAVSLALIRSPEPPRPTRTVATPDAAGDQRGSPTGRPAPRPHPADPPLDRGPRGRLVLRRPLHDLPHPGPAPGPVPARHRRLRRRRRLPRRLVRRRDESSRASDSVRPSSGWRPAPRSWAS